jgi:hypothetical protein
MDIVIDHGRAWGHGYPRASRSFHVIDLENLVGGAQFSAREVDGVRAAYERRVGIGRDDLVVVATSHHAARVAWFAWPQARRVARSGENGADLALIDILTRERISERFSSIIVASGDGIFAEPCARLQAAGCQVTVVSRPQALSRTLAFAVRSRITLYVDGRSVPARAIRRAA